MEDSKKIARAIILIFTMAGVWAVSTLLPQWAGFIELGRMFVVLIIITILTFVIYMTRK